ncbi:MAG TPA: hypothetical protein VJP85_00755 [Candidatus Baltobacteraceae bacterium]|nr:hypothetical protein [Candidatus Baltobacteraceae bacterium]
MPIYRAALKRLSALPQPMYIDSTMHWKVIAQTPQGDEPSAFDERVLFDSTARRECVLFVPYSSDSRVIIGPSYFAPDMWLLHKSPERIAQTTHPDFSPDLSDLKTIAAVVSVAKPSYEITFAGTDPISNGGGTAYHLLLKPLSDPWKHNLRELWVNSSNFNIVRAVLVGDYRPDNGQLLEQTTVAEDFGPVGPYWVVIHHTWSYRDAPNSVTFHYDATAQNMSFPAAIPPWYFDEAQFNQHRSQVNTSAVWP